MWGLYILMSIMAAGVTIKLMMPLLGKGRRRSEGAVTVEDRQMARLMMLLIPLVSLGLYLLSGRPDLQGAPAVFLRLREISDEHTSLLAERPLSILIEKNPEDVGALVSLAIVNQKIKHHEDAIGFYKRAVEFAEKQGDWRLRPIANMLGEAQVEAAQGVVTDDAYQTFLYVLTLHPESPIARYYIALWKAQHGNTDAAMNEWIALINEGPPNIHWKKRVRDSISETRAKLRAAK